MRLDVYLADQGLAESREKAKKLIAAGLVKINGRSVGKPAFEVEEPAQVEILADPFRFASRGGEKLEFAIEVFGVTPAGMKCVDIGASTGGFTDCLLRHGAKSVVAVDAGVGQLHPKLAADPRVQNIEKYNARALSPEDVGICDMAVMDVSFISATYILPRIPLVLERGGSFICLIKPQFEAGRAALGKRGVVRRESDRIFAVRRVLNAAGDCGMTLCGLVTSPIEGGDGNTEYLAHFRFTGEQVDHTDAPVEQVVSERAVYR